MLGRTYDREVCSAARALEVAGERWSLLILRNLAFAGMKRFGELQASLGIAPNVLAARLERFVAEQLVAVTTGDQGHPEYTLTPRGLDFKPVIAALAAWGDAWAAPDGPPIRFEHAGCGGEARSVMQCTCCGAAVPPAELLARQTPALARARERRRGSRRSR